MRQCCRILAEIAKKSVRAAPTTMRTANKGVGRKRKGACKDCGEEGHLGGDKECLEGIAGRKPLFVKPAEKASSSSSSRSRPPWRSNVITADGEEEMDAVIFGDDDYGLGPDGWECLAPQSGSDSPGKDWVKPETAETHEAFVMADLGCSTNLAGTAAQQRFVEKPRWSDMEFVHPDDAVLLHQQRPQQQDNVSGSNTPAWKLKTPACDAPSSGKDCEKAAKDSGRETESCSSSSGHSAKTSPRQKTAENLLRKLSRLRRHTKSRR